MSAIHTFMPCFAQYMATARPMPLLAPVMTAVFPSLRMVEAVKSVVMVMNRFSVQQRNGMSDSM
jgi:hypothetical protein